MRTTLKGITMATTLRESSKAGQDQVRIFEFGPVSQQGVSGATRMGANLIMVNQLLTDRGQPPLELKDLVPQVNQLKVFVDLCHLYGMAVIFDFNNLQHLRIPRMLVLGTPAAGRELPMDWSCSHETPSADGCECCGVEASAPQPFHVP